MKTILFVFIGVVFSNFVYQAFVGHDWAKAVERSYFQAIALGLVALFQYVK